MALGKFNFNYRGRIVTSLRALLRRRGLVPEFREAFEEINKVYAKFLTTRYKKFSKGGGNWKKLAPSTIAKKGHNTILVDEGIMIKEFSPKIIATHNIFASSGRPIFDVESGLVKRRIIAGYHQAGGPNLPKRPILVGPDTETNKKIAKIIERAMKKYITRTEKDGGK